MTDLEQYIHAYFGIKADEMSAISELFKIEYYKKGEFFLMAGQHCNQLSFIRSGIFYQRLFYYRIIKFNF
jgi:CRP/FNR family transcriptional regulator, anaerobic regulatory protein